ncbi:MAG: hypothetical protein ABIH41_05305 [Nanoarchaeota archaeon]
MRTHLHSAKGLQLNLQRKSHPTLIFKGPTLLFKGYMGLLVGGALSTITSV